MKRELLIVCTLALVGCHQREASSDSSQDFEAKDADTETCTACGMVIREQPAPRGQVLHRDGTREFLCSIDDLVQYLDVPSPRGKPKMILVEVMPDDHELDDMAVAFQDWDEAANLHFVVGIERGAVMGEPALTYRTKAAAEMVAVAHGGEVVTFDTLRERNRK